jgi:hypothetical protein
MIRIIATPMLYVDEHDRQRTQAAATDKSRPRNSVAFSIRTADFRLGDGRHVGKVRAAATISSAVGSTPIWDGPSGASWWVQQMVPERSIRK